MKIERSHRALRLSADPPMSVPRAIDRATLSLHTVPEIAGSPSGPRAALGGLRSDNHARVTQTHIQSLSRGGSHHAVQSYPTHHHNSMNSVNKIILVGNLAADPEVRQTSKGTTVATFPVATNRDFTSNGEKKKVTDFHRVVAWGKLAEICGKYLEKGKAVYVEGLILNRAYEKDGERRYVTEIRADEVNMLSFKRDREREQVTIHPVDNGAGSTTKDAD
jgi:single-strand DNA-binding protein